MRSQPHLKAKKATGVDVNAKAENMIVDGFVASATANEEKKHGVYSLPLLLPAIKVGVTVCDALVEIATLRVAAETTKMMKKATKAEAAANMEKAETAKQKQPDRDEDWEVVEGPAVDNDYVPTQNLATNLDTFNILLPGGISFRYQSRGGGSQPPRKPAGGGIRRPVDDGECFHCGLTIGHKRDRCLWRDLPKRQAHQAGAAWLLSQRTAPRMLSQQPAPTSQWSAPTSHGAAPTSQSSAPISHSSAPTLDYRVWTPRGGSQAVAPTSASQQTTPRRVRSSSAAPTLPTGASQPPAPNGSSYLLPEPSQTRLPASPTGGLPMVTLPRVAPPPAFLPWLARLTSPERRGFQQLLLALIEQQDSQNGVVDGGRGRMDEVEEGGM
ncbi:hypothetical protein LTR08_001910 [Meristemomyces frigidus]|nr:hypothetical protein LTR08_001910 [Meristemomyces frigidus]